MGPDRLADLYRTYGPTIYARCRRLLGDDAAAEDAMQETFMRVRRHLDRAPNSREALAWIYRIATNYCLNELRDAKVRAVPVEELPETLSGQGEELHIDRDLAARLIGRAPEKVRAVAWLHYVDGMAQGEVAKVLGTSRRTVLYRLATFLRNARKFTKRAEQ